MQYFFINILEIKYNYHIYNKVNFVSELQLKEKAPISEGKSRLSPPNRILLSKVQIYLYFRYNQYLKAIINTIMLSNKPAIMPINKLSHQGGSIVL